MVVAVCLGVPIGIISAVKQYSIFDMVSMAFALIGISMPVFWLGLLLILLFSVNLKILPSSGYDGFAYMILPAISLGAQSVAVITRMTRSSMLEVINMDYIKTARSKGQNERVVILKHALGNALIPIITSVGLQFGGLLGGAVLTESIFSIPGIGRLMVDSIKMRDYPVVQGGVLIIAIAFCFVNLFVDLLYAFVDPRIKAQYK
jgi:peptide/nickel transport system permease protein